MKKEDISKFPIGSVWTCRNGVEYVITGIEIIPTAHEPVIIHQHKGRNCKHRMRVSYWKEEMKRKDLI